MNNTKLIIGIVVTTLLLLVGAVFLLSNAPTKPKLEKTEGAKLQVLENSFDFKNIPYVELSFLGIKLPMPSLPGTNIGGRTDALSIFMLGIVSGITSACCAPVLVGILTLTFLSPNFFGALAVGGVYVLGMVTPLLLISLFLTDKMPKFTILRQPLTTLTIFRKNYPIILGNLVASILFLITGLAALILLRLGGLSNEGMEGFTKFIQNTGNTVNQVLGNNPLVNIGSFFIFGLLIYLVWKKL